MLSSTVIQFLMKIGHCSHPPTPIVHPGGGGVISADFSVISCYKNSVLYWPLIVSWPLLVKKWTSLNMASSISSRNSKEVQLISTGCCLDSSVSVFDWKSPKIVWKYTFFSHAYWTWMCWTPTWNPIQFSSFSRGCLPSCSCYSQCLDVKCDF